VWGSGGFGTLFHDEKSFDFFKDNGAFVNICSQAFKGKTGGEVMGRKSPGNV
jgi:hypothetical protein